MIRPMPFWPSFEPCAKLTPVQVSTRRPRIHHGGGVAPSGARYSAGIRISALASSSKAAARTKPAKGENSSDLPTPAACPQSTPLVPLGSLAMIWFIRPTPMIEPISACELEFEIPGAEVPDDRRDQQRE